ncbi:MAG: D-alanyl-D-alanine carboxypeptidase [Lachnospiraceae bacterium]|nr:D-alanyl-D-alanine carboxypeptidase [Lachnospiraceae bacterium]
MRDYESEERLRQQQRARRRRELQKRRRRQKRILTGCLLLLLILLVGMILFFVGGHIGASSENGKLKESELEELESNVETDSTAQQDTGETQETEEESVTEEEPEEESSETVVYSAEETASTVSITSDSVISSYAILIDIDEGTVVATKDAYTRVSPASMTKILTVLTAADYITDLDDTFTITIDITDFAYSNDCSAVGFDEGETVTVRDLLYGTVLPSGGDAAAGLAIYTAGSMEAFVELMNQKVEELGLSDSAHFTNCVGLYDEDLYCTVYDMAIILEAAINNELCRDALSAHTYTTSSTEQHPDGITVSNWFLRRIEDKDTGGEVVCAKTGFVDQSGSCAASYEITDSGKQYICVTANSTSSWRCIYDHVEIYLAYTQ